MANIWLAFKVVGEVIEILKVIRKIVKDTKSKRAINEAFKNSDAKSLNDAFRV